MTDRIASAPQASHALKSMIADLQAAEQKSGCADAEVRSKAAAATAKKARAAKITRARDIRAQDRRAIGLHPAPHPRATLAAASALGLIAAAICAHLAGVF